MKIKKILMICILIAIILLNVTCSVNATINPDDYKPAGVLPLCNFGGMAIMEIKGDYVYVCDNYGDGYKNITKNLIQYTQYGKPFFRRNKQVWYLSDFMKAA